MEGGEEWKKGMCEIKNREVKENRYQNTGNTNRGRNKLKTNNDVVS